VGDSATAASLIAAGVWALLDTRWALLDTQPAGGLFSFPHNGTDALLHFGTSAIFLAGAVRHFVTSRATPQPSAGTR
jgi:hypothetical protein